MTNAARTSLPPEIVSKITAALEAGTDREVEPVVEQRSQRIGDILRRMGRLSVEEITEIREKQLKTGELFGKIALRKGFVTAQDIRAAIAVQFGYFHADPETLKIPPKLVTISKPFSTEAEQFRMLRTRLLAQSGGVAAKLLSVAGATEKVGTAYTTANLAVAFSQINRKTLLIDANLRKPQVAKTFRVKPEFGLTDLLNDACTVQQAMSSSQIRNLTLLTAGAVAHNPQELLGLPKFAEVVMSSLDRFDTVLIQTTDGSEIADGQFVWALAKSVMLLARKNDTKSKDLLATADLIRECGAHIAGTVLTG